MKRLTPLALIVVALVFTATNRAFAADEKGYTGTFTWTQPGRNGNDVEYKIELKQDGDKVTGTLYRGNAKSKIEEGAIKDGQLTFKTSRTRNGNTTFTTYTGKLDGDTIKGKIETPSRNGDTTSRDWEAKRAKDKDKE